MKSYYITDNTIEGNYCYWLCMTDRSKIVVEYDTHTATECHIRHIAHTCGRTGLLAIIQKPWLPKTRKINIRDTVYTVVYPSFYALKKHYPRYSKAVKACKCKPQYIIKKCSF